jgi:ubiquinone/menaquinone biosynthesis C-methylase UbiE
MIRNELDPARTVINVGAGAGSYEPEDYYVVAVEPSPAMRARRPPSRPPAIDTTAEQLPFDDDSFDAAMATLMVHHWRDPARGLGEMRRVTPRSGRNSDLRSERLDRSLARRRTPRRS